MNGLSLCFLDTFCLMQLHWKNREPSKINSESTCGNRNELTDKRTNEQRDTQRDRQRDRQSARGAERDMRISISTLYVIYHYTHAHSRTRTHTHTSAAM